MYKNITKNFSALIVSHVFYKLLSFFAIAYVARQIGDAKFGQLSFALYLGILFFALADMGLSEVYICEAAGNKTIEAKVMGISIGSRIIFSLLAFFLLIICTFLFSSVPDLAILILLIGISMIIDSATFLLRSVFRAREQMEYEAVSLTLEGLIKLLILALAVRIFKTDVLFLGFAFLAISIIAFLITMIICKNKFFLAKPVFNLELFIKFFKRGLPFAIVGLLSIVSLKIDTIMLARMVTDSVAGWYSAAVRLLESVLVVPITLSVVLFPIVSRFHKNSRRSFYFLYKFSSIVCLIIGLFSAFLLYICSNVSISFIFGEAFMNSGYIVRILSPIIALFFMKLFLERVVLVAGKTDILLKAYLGGVVLKIVLNLYLIPLMSYQGAAFSTILTEILILIYILVRTNKYFYLAGIKVMPERILNKSFFLREEY